MSGSWRFHIGDDALEITVLKLRESYPYTELQERAARRETTNEDLERAARRETKKK